MNKKIDKKVLIKLSEKTSDKIKDFEKVEWELADEEHYGRPVDFTKKKYKFVAETDDGDIAGTLELMIEANLAFIEYLIVGSKYRKMGIGKEMIKTVENFAKEHYCTKVYLETNEGWGAVEFYKKIGYEITGAHEKHMMNQKSLIFTKFL